MAHYIRPHGEGCLVRFGEVCARKSEAAKMELADPPASRTPGSISSSPNPNPGRVRFRLSLPGLRYSGATRTTMMLSASLLLKPLCLAIILIISLQITTDL